MDYLLFSIFVGAQTQLEVGYNQMADNMLSKPDDLPIIDECQWRS